MASFTTIALPTGTGIFPVDKIDHHDLDRCYCCGRRARPDCQRFILERHTREIMDPRLPDPDLRGIAPRPIGPECRKLYPGIERYAVDAKGKPMACDKCGRPRKLHDYDGHRWCGTCISRHERRINCREMWGRGRRGY